MNAGIKVYDDGLDVAAQLLLHADPEPHLNIVPAPGWHGLTDGKEPYYVCPGGEIIRRGSAELKAGVRIPDAVAKAGTLEGWQAMVSGAATVPGCPHWTLACIIPFAGPLVSLTDLDTCGLNLSGRTSGGKTTAQKIAVSAWSKPAIAGNRSLFQAAKTTVNALEAMAAKANGTIFSLDELAHISGKEIAKVIYTVAGGTGKARMNANADMKASYTWRTFVLFSSEKSLRERVSEENAMAFSGGMTARLPDIDVTKVNRKVPLATRQAIDSGLENFGHAGPEFVRRFVAEGLHTKAQALRETVLDLATEIAGEGADSARVRAAQPFALLQCAGTYARELGVLPKSVDVGGAVDWAWQQYQSSGDASMLDPAASAITAIRNWIAVRWGSSIQNVGKGNNSDVGLGDPEDRVYRDAVGWYDEDAVYLLPEHLAAAAGGSLKETEIVSVLKDGGHLCKFKSDKHNYVEYVPRRGKVRAYALSRDSFGSTSGRCGRNA